MISLSDILISPTVSVSFKLFLWLAGAVALTALLEYLAHRFFMHRPLLDRFGLRGVFQKHALIHHRDGRNDLNVDLPIRTHFLWGFTFVGVSGYFEIAGAVIVAASFVGHAVLWTRLHRAIHGLEKNWSQSLWIYRAVERHHLEHHRSPTRNFGAVFPFTDYLFFTRSRPNAAVVSARRDAEALMNSSSSF